MKRIRKACMAAVIGGLTYLGTPALGQQLQTSIQGGFQQGLRSGGLQRSLFRDMRVNGGGGDGGQYNNNSYNNALVTGNVGGLAAFRGNVGYGLQGEFQGGTGSDDVFRFQSRSAGGGAGQLGNDTVIARDTYGGSVGGDGSGRGLPMTVRGLEAARAQAALTGDDSAFRQGGGVDSAGRLMGGSAAMNGPRQLGRGLDFFPQNTQQQGGGVGGGLGAGGTDPMVGLRARMGTGGQQNRLADSSRNGGLRGPNDAMFGLQSRAIGGQTLSNSMFGRDDDATMSNPYSVSRRTLLPGLASQTIDPTSVQLGSASQSISGVALGAPVGGSIRGPGAAAGGTATGSGIGWLQGGGAGRNPNATTGLGTGPAVAGGTGLLGTPTGRSPIAAPGTAPGGSLLAGGTGLGQSPTAGATTPGLSTPGSPFDLPGTSSGANPLGNIPSPLAGVVGTPTPGAGTVPGGLVPGGTADASTGAGTNVPFPGASGIPLPPSGLATSRELAVGESTLRPDRDDSTARSGDRFSQDRDGNKPSGVTNLPELTRADAVASGSIQSQRAQRYIVRANELMSEGKYTEAERLFLSAQVEDDRNAQAFAGMIHARIGLGHFDKAADNMRLFFYDHPEMIKVRYPKPILGSKAAVQDKLMLLRATAAQNPQSRSVHMVRAYVAYQESLQDEVRESYRMIRGIGAADAVINDLFKEWLR